ncbi:MAG: DMT family transporter [Bacteroidales bacterium]|jgi:drug/metabolite transporter (DMT)-like permease
MQKKNNIHGAITIILAAIMWGVDGVILTPNLLNNKGIPLNVSFVVFILHLLPFIIMNFIWFNAYKKVKFFTLRDVLDLSLVALTGGALGTMCIVKALFLVNFQNLTIVALLQKFQPIFAIILSVIILKEKLSKKFYVLASITIIAGYIMTFSFDLPNKVSNNVIQAASLALLAAFFFGTSTVLSKKVLKKYSPAESTFFRYGFTTIIAFLIVLFSNNLNVIYTVPTKTWILFFIIAFTTGSGAILLYYNGLKHINAASSSIYELFFPITTAVLDYFINDNTMTWIQWVAAAIMVISIMQISKLPSNVKN